MDALFSDAWSILSALLTFDSWTISEALRTPGAWLVGLFATVVGAILVAFIYAKVRWIEENLERYVMIWTYLMIAAIISVEVVRRFLFSVQAPWSTTLPPFLFLIMAWAACSYNVKLRTHLTFSEFRTRMPRSLQFACLVLDAALWVGFSWIVIVTSTRVVANSAANFQILLGTDHVQQWWLLISVPLSFLLIAARALENLLLDWRNYVARATLIQQASLASD